MLNWISNAKTIIVGAIGAALVVCSGVFYMQRNAARDDLAAANAKLTVARSRATALESANATLASEVAVANAAIDDSQKQAQVRAAAADAAVAKATADADRYRQQIAARNAKPLTANACADADAMLNDYLKESK